MPEKKPIKKSIPVKKEVKTKVAEKVEDISGCVVVFKNKKLAVDYIRVSVGATIATRDYESARFDFAVQLRPMEKDTDMADMAEIAWDVAKQEVSKQIIAVREKMNKKAE